MSSSNNKNPAEDVSKAGATSSSVADDAALRWKLAAIEHERWADWQKWCHEVIRKHVPYSPERELVLARWDKQIETPYEKLSEAEKASDMEQVDRYWQLITQHTAAAVRAAQIQFKRDSDANKYFFTVGVPDEKTALYLQGICTKALADAGRSGEGTS